MATRKSIRPVPKSKLTVAARNRRLRAQAQRAKLQTGKR